MKYKYITIEREYGSGGAKIARRLAEECGISCYGQEILEEVSKKQNIPLEQIVQYEESVTNSFLYSIFMMSKAQSGDADMVTKEGHIHVAEQEAIRNLAEEGPAIFIGHCASEALKNKKGVIKVFIRCSNEEEKNKRIIDDYGIPEEKVDTTKKRIDKKRANYYYANTTIKWNNLTNYDIILDSALLDIDGCVNVLKGLLTQ